jgi:predicted  nucleic acid-binding Zn-ribbon protein
MAICIKCGEEYSDKRAELGYKTCLECGAKDAQKETKRKSKCIAPAYNKGAYQYITSKECVKGIYPNKT